MREYVPTNQKTVTTGLGTAYEDIYVHGHDIMVWYSVADSAGSLILSDEAYVIPYTDSSSSGELKVTRQPEDVTCAIGETATFRVEVEGGKKPYTYQWCYSNASGTRIFNPSIGSSSVLSFAVDTKEFYDISIFCQITDANGDTVKSQYAQIRGGSLKIVKQPGSYAVYEGDSFEASIVVTGGTEPYKYDWQTKRADEDDSKWASFHSGINGKSTTSFEVEWYDYEHVFRCIVTDKLGNLIVSNLFYVLDPNY